MGVIVVYSMTLDLVMDSGSLKRSCARALTIAWLHIIRPTHLCLVYGREIVGPGSMTAHYYTKKENVGRHPKMISLSTHTDFHGRSLA